MTRCILSNRYSSREMNLDEALKPEDVLMADGVAERAADAAKLANEVLGKLLANLVERRIISLDDAREIAGVLEDIEII